MTHQEYLAAVVLAEHLLEEEHGPWNHTKFGVECYCRQAWPCATARLSQALVAVHERTVEGLA